MLIAIEGPVLTLVDFGDMRTYVYWIFFKESCILL